MQASKAGLMPHGDSSMGIKVGLYDAALVGNTRRVISLSEALNVLLQRVAEDSTGGNGAASKCSSGVDWVNHKEVRQVLRCEVLRHISLEHEGEDERPGDSNGGT